MRVLVAGLWLVQLLLAIFGCWIILLSQRMLHNTLNGNSTSNVIPEPKPETKTREEMLGGLALDSMFDFSYSLAGVTNGTTSLAALTTATNSHLSNSSGKGFRCF